MSGHNDKWTDLITQFAETNRTAPALTLAKAFKQLYPDSPSVDALRTRFRVRFGQKGTTHRLQHPDTLQRPPRPAGVKFFGEIAEPLVERDETPYVLNGTNMLVLADVHIPFHDKLAVDMAVKCGKKYKPDTIVLLGDLTDNHQESYFNHVFDSAMFGKELNMTKLFLAYLREQFPKAKIVWKEGNHEERFQMKLNTQMQAEASIMGTFTYKECKCEELGIDVVRERRFLHAGHLTLIHGHELGKGTFSPVSPSRTAMLKCGDQVMLAHFHITTQQRGKTIRGNHPAAWSVGCLCKMAPLYSPVNNWNQGFAMIERHGPDAFLVHNKTILDGKVV